MVVPQTYALGGKQAAHCVQQARSSTCPASAHGGGGEALFDRAPKHLEVGVEAKPGAPTKSDSRLAAMKAATTTAAPLLATAAATDVLASTGAAEAPPLVELDTPKIEPVVPKGSGLDVRTTSLPDDSNSVNDLAKIMSFREDWAD
eukprot:CAMPEP_0117570928 /NCGR_PEP_ID=MMETSP0784-20121206/59465_1 /TAXON_ID=39447 /ORGANISM="" /LENGTH=145 /DNA_ID=CAMNT_0005369025 /DNA_START=145 /DNA_END=582 /DNA_ORIENTATION=-